MGISGNIKTMVLAELLQWLSMGQKTGTLVIDSGAVKKRIFFEEGMIISSASTDEKEYLGRFLANHGFIPEDTVNEAVSRQKQEQQLLGKILVNMGAISEEDLHQVLRLKAEESIYDIFTWDQGDFEFLDNDLPEETMVRMQLDVQGLVLEGTRRVDEWSRLRDVIPSNLCVPVTVADLDQVPDIDEIDRQILAWVDDDRTIDEISAEAQISIFQVAEAVAAQVMAGHVKVVRPRTIEVRVEVPVEASAKDGDPAPQQQQQQQQQMMPPQQQQMMYPQGMPMQGYAPQQPMYSHPPQQQPSGPGVNMGSGRTLHFAGDSGGGGSAPPEPSSEAQELLQKGEKALHRGYLDEAIETFRKAKEAEGTSSTVEAAADAGEKKVLQALERQGVGLAAVPKLECSLDELMKLDISPQQGFMLTRVDGSFDLKSILKMSPMPKVEAQLLFWRLKRSGHVTL